MTRTVGPVGQIAITVSDVDLALAYYRDVLGLAFLFRAGPHLAFLTDGSVRLMLSTPQGHGAPGANSVLYFTVQDVESTYAAIVARGSAAERAPQLIAKMPDHDLWMGFLRDHDGNLVGLMEGESGDRGNGESGDRGNGRPPNGDLSRRSFLQASGGALVGTAGARPRPAQTVNFAGSRRGEERTVEGVRLCWCPPGRFLMGSPLDEPGRRADESPVEVRLTRGFWTAKFEITQSEWRRIVGAFPDRLPTTEFGLGDDVPMYWVNWFEADRFAEALTARAHRSGELPPNWVFRLPTEAQWEYACRASTTTASAFGAELTLSQVNLGGGRSGGLTGAMGRATPVGTYRANAWGLCDMHGNIFEWCRDWYHAALPGGVDPDLSNELGVQNGDGTYSRCRRGGAWNDPPAYCRSAMRLRYEPERRSDHIGFRVVAVFYTGTPSGRAR